MEASALSHASRRGLLARRSPLLRLQGDDHLVALVRAGNDSAFEVLWDRYRTRLLAYCRSIVRSTEDAEDVLQEVFVNAHAAMIADERKLMVRPWLYRIARNRSLNHLRKPVADGQDSMDVHLHANGATAHDDAERREDVRQLVADVKTLPETQRTALILREIDALSYDEIAQAMETTIPSVKSLLVRARISLGEASESRLLTCDDVRLELAAAAEGLAKVNGPMRRHVRECEECHSFRKQLRDDSKALAALSPIGLLAVAQALAGKLFGGAAGGSAAGGSVAGGSGAAAAGAGAATGAASAGAGAAGAGAAAAASGAIATGSAAGGGAVLGGIGSALGAKAAATAATAAIITAGAVEVSKKQPTTPAPEPAAPVVRQSEPAAKPAKPAAEKAKPVPAAGTAEAESTSATTGEEKTPPTGTAKTSPPAEAPAPAVVSPPQPTGSTPKQTHPDPAHGAGTTQSGSNQPAVVTGDALAPGSSTSGESTTGDSTTTTTSTSTTPSSTGTTTTTAPVSP